VQQLEPVANYGKGTASASDGLSDKSRPLFSVGDEEPVDGSRPTPVAESAVDAVGQDVGGRMSELQVVDREFITYSFKI